MTLGSTLASHTFFSLLSAASNGLLVVLVIVAARILGPEDFGKYATGMAFVFLLEPLTDLGMREYLTREVARNREVAKRAFAVMSSIKLALCAGTAVLIFPIAAALGYTGEIMLVSGILAVAMFFRSYKFAVRCFFRAFGRYDFETALVVGERVVTLIMALIVLWSGGGLIGFVMVFPAVRLVDFVVTLIVFRKKIGRIGLSLNWDEWRAMLVGSLPFALMLGMGVLYSRIDVLMLSAMRPFLEVGWYSTGYTLIDVSIIVPMVLSAAVFPTLSVLSLSDRNKFEVICRRTVKYLIIAAAAFMFGGLAVADEIILALFGKAYANSADVLRILLGSLGFSFVASLSTIFLFALDRQRQALFSLVITVLIVVLLNFLLIPRFGFIGAAVGTALAQLTYFVTLMVQLRHANCHVLSLRLIWRPVTAGVIMAYMTHHISDWSLFFVIPVAAVSYVGILLLLGAFDRTEFTALRKLIGPRKSPGSVGPR